MNGDLLTTNSASAQDESPKRGSAFGWEISPAAFRKALVMLFLLGLIVRLVFLVEHASSPEYGVASLDQKYYDTVARMILTGEDLHQLHGYKPLMYPMFLAACYKVGGTWGMDLVILLQHLFGILTGIFVAVLSARLFRNRLCGVIAGALYLLAPLPLCIEGDLLTESSYTFLIVLGLLLFLRASESRGWKAVFLWVASGALTVLTAQGRSNFLIFAGVYPMFVAWQWWRVRNRSALMPLTAAAGGLAMLLVWGVINMKQTDHFTLLPSAGGVNLYLGNKRTADGMVAKQGRRVNYGDQYQDPIEIWAREEYAASMRSKGLPVDENPAAISRFWQDKAVEEIRADPVAWLKLMAKKSWLSLWNKEIPNNKSFGFLQEEFVSLHVLPVRWVVLLIFFPAGIWAAARWGCRNTLFVFLAFVVLYSAGNVAFFITDRYRYPVWPAMAAIAGGGLLMLAGTIVRRDFRAVKWLVASMAFLAILSLHNWFGSELPSYARDYLFRSIAYYEKGRFPEALNDINRSLALDPSDATALHQQGNIFVGLGRNDLAKGAYERTLQLSPDDSSVWNNYGVVLDAINKPEDALKAYRRATELEPPSTKAFIGMACIQIRQGRVEDASTTMAQFEKRESAPDASALAVRAAIERRRGNLQNALRLEGMAQQMDSNAVPSVVELIGKSSTP